MNMRNVAFVCHCNNPDCPGIKINYPAVRAFERVMLNVWNRMGCPDECDGSVTDPHLRMVARRFDMTRNALGLHAYLARREREAYEISAMQKEHKVPGELMERIQSLLEMLAQAGGTNRVQPYDNRTIH